MCQHASHLSFIPIGWKLVFAHCCFGSFLLDPNSRNYNVIEKAVETITAESFRSW
jgi:hypothetical protein